MASFDIFGPPTKDGIKVGYISTTRGRVDGVSILDANKHAKKDPGTVFIYRTRKATQFLNINEVNALQPSDEIIPASCEDGLKLESTPEDARIVFMGGNGVGVRANPIIGRDGAVLAVDLVSGGFGYEYPPLAEVRDDSTIGAGAVLRVVTGEQVNTEIIYSDEEDFEEYIIPEEKPPGWGDQYTPEGKLLGQWNPQVYGMGQVGQFDRQVNRFIRDVNRSGKNWWTTRMHPPLKVASNGKTTNKVYNMSHKPYWHEFLDTYGISPKPRSNAKPSDFAGQWFTFEWDQEFPYDGEYKFRAQCDNKAKIYLDNKSLSSFNLGFGGASGHVLSNPESFSETIKKGSHIIRIDLYNEPLMETAVVQQETKVETQVSGVDFIKKSDGFYMQVGGNNQVEVSLKLWWDDNPITAGTAVTKITIPNPGFTPLVLERTKKGDNWTVSGTASAKSVFLRSEVGYGPIQFEGLSSRGAVLVNKNVAYAENVGKHRQIKFMDAHDDDTNALLSVVSAKNLQESWVAKIKSSSSRSTQNKGQTRNVFNTIDYIDKANRKLWRTNVYNRGGFLNDYGVCPFYTKL